MPIAHPKNPGHRDHGEHGVVEIDRRREDVGGVQGRARRRGLSERLDQSGQPRHHPAGRRSGRRRHAQRRRDAGAPGTTSRPASSTTSPRTTRFPIASAADSRRTDRSASRAAATTARSRIATGCRSASTNTASSRPIRSTPTSSTAAATSRGSIGGPGRCRSSGPLGGRGGGGGAAGHVPPGAHDAGDLLRGGQARAVLRQQPSLEDGRRRRALEADQSRPDATDLGDSEERRQVRERSRRRSRRRAASSTPWRRRTRTSTASGSAPTTG